MSAKTRKCSGCPSMIERSSVTGLCRKCLDERMAALRSGKPLPADPAVQLEADRLIARLKVENGALKGRYQKAVETIDQLEISLGVKSQLREHVSPFVIEPQVSGGTNEATPIVVASDWHMEQRVTKAETNGLNEYNLEEASRRGNHFFTAGLRLIRLLNQDVAINAVVLGLLGDFITSQIHGAANAENNLLPPTQALVFAQNHLISGIEFWLNHSPYKLVIVCKVGNHSRNTEKSRIGYENGHSYEYLMYLNMQERFKKTAPDRVTFIIEDSFNSYVEVYGETFRFNHGHTIKFLGGVGGLFIPAYKKIDKWDKQRRATRTVIGHHHQYLDGGNFHCNGSMIGFDGRAAGEGYSYEPPMQTLLLVDRKRGQTCKWPILFS